MAVDRDRMTPQQWADWNGKAMARALGDKSKNKYQAERTEYNGVLYDSKAEADYARLLDHDHRVHWWLRQVPIPLGPDFSTRVDFLVGYISYVQAHEVKGAETREFKRVRKLWPKYGPFYLRVIKGGEVELIRGKP